MPGRRSGYNARMSEDEGYSAVGGRFVIGTIVLFVVIHYSGLSKLPWPVEGLIGVGLAAVNILVAIFLQAWVCANIRFGPNLLTAAVFLIGANMLTLLAASAIFPLGLSSVADLFWGAFGLAVIWGMIQGIVDLVTKGLGQ